MQAIEEKEGGVLLRVRVQPKSSRNALHIEPDGRIRVALTAPAVRGSANKALVAFIAKRVGLSKGAVKVIRGERSREKTLVLDGITAPVARAKLGAP